MPRDGQFIALTGEEAAAIHMWDLERDEFHVALEWVRGNLEETAESAARLNFLEVRFNAAAVEMSHVIHARLCRMMPHLADVIALACFPEFMPTPEFLEQRGTPLPWVLAGTRRVAKEWS